jgi:predicted DNA-binding antitoxin AbrB/MazE fold protein
MSRTIDAVYDGQVFWPSEPVRLKPNTRVKIIVDTEEEERDKPKSFLQTARALNLDGPADWARNTDDYLYGEDDDNDS